MTVPIQPSVRAARLGAPRTILLLAPGYHRLTNAFHDVEMNRSIPDSEYRFTRLERFPAVTASTKEKSAEWQRAPSRSVPDRLQKHAVSPFSNAAVVNERGSVRPSRRVLVVAPVRKMVASFRHRSMLGYRRIRPLDSDRFGRSYILQDRMRDTGRSVVQASRLRPSLFLKRVAIERRRQLAKRGMGRRP